MVRAVGEIFALNVVVDEERRIGFVNFGPIEQSHWRRWPSCGTMRKCPARADSRPS